LVNIWRKEQEFDKYAKYIYVTKSNNISMELSILDIGCELEQDDFVVIFKAFYEGYISRSDKYYPPRCSSINQKTCSSLAGAWKITQKSRSELSTLDFCFVLIKQNEEEIYYFNARWFDPEMGIFLTEDPAKPDYKDPLTMNTYAYCKNNPIMNIDPDGEFWNFIVNIISAFAVAYGTSAGLQWVGNGFDFSKIDWKAANKAGSFAAMSYAFGGYGTENLLGDAWHDEMIEFGISDGISSMSTGGDFYEGFNSGMKDYLMRRTWDGMSFDLDDSNYLSIVADLRQGLAFGNGLVIAHPNVFGFFEHWHTITEASDFGFVGKSYLGAGYGSYEDYPKDASKYENYKFRVISSVKNPDMKKFNVGFVDYVLPWNNCVHAAKSQIRNSTNYRGY